MKSLFVLHFTSVAAVYADDNNDNDGISCHEFSEM